MSAKVLYDWPLIADKYVMGGDDVTLESLAKEFGCGPTTIRRRASIGKWTTQREQYRHQVQRKTREEVSTYEAKRRAAMLEVADELVNLGRASLRRTARRMVQEPEFVLAENEARLLVKDGQELQRKAMGMPDEVALTGGELDAAIERELARLARGRKEGDAAPAAAEEQAAGRVN